MVVSPSPVLCDRGVGPLCYPCLYVLQVIRHYQEEGFDFLLKAFDCPSYLEDLTGLSMLYAQTFDDQVCLLFPLLFPILF